MLIYLLKCKHYESMNFICTPEPRRGLVRYLWFITYLLNNWMKKCRVSRYVCKKQVQNSGPGVQTFVFSKDIYIFVQAWALWGREQKKLIIPVAWWWENMRVWVTGRLTFYFISFCIIWILNKSRYFYFKKKQNKTRLKFTLNTNFHLVTIMEYFLLSSYSTNTNVLSNLHTSHLIPVTILWYRYYYHTYFI